jgi:O-antigen ligase
VVIPFMPGASKDVQAIHVHQFIVHILARKSPDKTFVSMSWQQIRYRAKMYEPLVFEVLSIVTAYMLVFWHIGNLIIALLLGVYWLLFSKKVSPVFSMRYTWVALFCCVFLLSLIGLLYTANFKEGMGLLAQKATMIIFPLVYGTTKVMNREMLGKVGLHFSVAVIIASILGLAKAAVIFFRTSAFAAGKSVVFFHLTYPYLFGLFCLTATLLVLSGEVKFSSKVTRFLLVALWSVPVFLIGVRTIEICWVLQKISSIATVLVIALAASVFVTPLRKQWQEILQPGAQNDIPLDRDASLGRAWGGKAIRVAIWQCSKSIVKENWLVGVGTGDAQDSLQQAYENRQFYFASRYNRYNAHNQYLQILIAFGILGLFVFISSLITPLFYLVRTKTGMYYLVFLILLAVIGMSEVLLDTSKGVMWYSFFNSIFAFTILNTSNERT